MVEEAGMNSRKILYKKEHLDMIFRNSQCLLYGAGPKARTIVKYMNYNHFTVNRILVTNMQGNPHELMGISVKSVAEYKNIRIKMPLIVCVTEKWHDEVEEVISDFDFEEIFYISDELYAKIIKEQLFFWNDYGERNIIKENWGKVIEDNNFKERFLNLIKDLDEESIEIIVRILKGQKQILESDADMLDLFAQDEKEKLKDLQEKFWPFILELEADLYCYKKFLLPCNHFEPSVFYYKHGIEKCKNLKSVEGKKIIDVGGFIGDSVLVLSELSPSQLISFEAVPEHVKYMEKTVKLNHLDNVVLVNSALGSRRGTIHMKLAGSGSTATDRKGIEFEGELEVPVISLDEYVKENNVTDIGLIKVDIEGAEPDFLAGAKDTISKYKPILLLSIYHNAHDFFELKPLIESWNLGYRFCIHKSVNGNITNETLLIAQIYD